MKTVFQLKNRITWEIQTLRDRANQIEKLQECRAKFGLPPLPKWIAERASIDNQIGMLTELARARVETKQLVRLLKTAEPLVRPAIRKNLGKVNGRVTELCTALSIYA